MKRSLFVQHPLLPVAALLIAGMAAGYVWTDSTPWLAGAGIALAATLAVCRWRMAAGVGGLLLSAAVGGWLMARAVEQTRVKLPAGDVEYAAVLLSAPVVRGKVVMADMLIVDSLQTMKVKATLLRDTAEGRWKRLQVGSGLRARSMLASVDSQQKRPFDYGRYLREHGFRARTFIYKDNWREATVSLQALPHTERTMLLARELRHRLLQRIGSLDADGQSYAVLSALVLGEKAFLSRDIKDDYSVSGASHVLALSGLHLGIVYALLSLLMLGWRRQWAAQLLTMTLIWSYVVLVGLSPSVVRSAVMLTVYALVTVMGRSRFSLNTLALTAIIMLAVDPLMLLDTGFQMSFLAVLGILLFFPLIHNLVPAHRRQSRPLAWVWGMVAVSLSAQMLVFPLVVLYFGRFSCYFLLANFIAIPCATVILYGAVLLVPLSLCPTLAHLLAKGLLLVARVMNLGLQTVAALPGASIEGITWTGPQVVSIYVLIGCIYLLWRFWSSHHSIFQGKFTPAPE